MENWEPEQLVALQDILAAWPHDALVRLVAEQIARDEPVSRFFQIAQALRRSNPRAR